MAFLIPTTIFAYLMGDAIADNIMSGVSAIHETYLSIEKSVQDYSDRFHQQEIQRQQQEYRQKADMIRDKWNV
jgi:hypothetical protein